MLYNTDKETQCVTLNFRDIMLHKNRNKHHSLVSIAKPAELLLASSIPAVEADFPTVGVEIQRMHLNTDSSCRTEIKDPLLQQHQQKLKKGRLISGTANQILTLVFLLKLSRKMPLDKCGFACSNRSQNLAKFLNLPLISRLRR